MEILKEKQNESNRIIERSRIVYINKKTFPDSEFRNNLISFLQGYYRIDISNGIVDLNKNNITIINLSDAKNISNMKGIEKFTDLEYLDISNTNVSNLGFLGALEKIETLIISNLPLKGDLRELKKCPNLKSLIAVNVGLTDMSILNYFPKLETLDLSSNLIKNIPNDLNLKYLRYLSLKNAQLKNVDFLIGSENLKWLDLSENEILDAKGLENSKNLSLVRLSHNKLSDIGFLSDKEKIEYLFLDSNKLEGENVIDTLLNLKSKNLSILNIEKNELAEVLTSDISNEIVKNISPSNFIIGKQYLSNSGNRIKKDYSLWRHKDTLKKRLANSKKNLTDNNEKIKEAEKRAKSFVLLK